MLAAHSETEIVRKELEEILKSPGFARNERLCRFLRFLVEGHLEGRDRELKESVIGVEVFGRKPDYDPKLDSVVRTEPRRLRARLSEYYKLTGAGAAVIIDLPKGGYVPVIKLAAQILEAAGTRQEASRPSVRKWPLAAALLASAVAAGAVVGWIRLKPATDTRFTNSPAYGVYLQARASEMRPAGNGIELSIELFEQAIGKDPSFAPAYAGLAAMEAFRSGFDRFTPAQRAAMIAKGWDAAAKAMELDPGWLTRTTLWE